MARVRKNEVMEMSKRSIARSLIEELDLKFFQKTSTEDLETILTAAIQDRQSRIRPKIFRKSKEKL